MEKVDLYTFEGYYHYWFSLLPGRTQQEAWELTEDKWHEITGSSRKRYSSLESFLAVKHRHFEQNGRL